MNSPRVLLVSGQGRENGLGQHLLAQVSSILREQGIQPRLHDLLADGFDPVLRLRPDQASAEAVSADEDPLVARYQEDVIWAELLVIVHPVWWFAPPALLKGWVDRVLAGGVALDHSSEPPSGLLKGRRALVVQTFKTSRTVDRILMGGMSGKFWSRVVLPSVGISPCKVLSLYGSQAPWGQRLARFEDRLRTELKRLLPPAVP